MLPLLAAIIVLGVAAQWLAWRVGLPAILLLLVFGIVAAAISSVFAIRLEALGYAETGTLTSITFFTIIVTVGVYGLTAPLAARKLGLAESNPQGLLFVGANAWVHQLAKLLTSEGFRVLVPIPESYQHICSAENPFSASHTDREGILGPARNLDNLFENGTSSG